MFKNFNWGHGIVVALGVFIAFILFMIFIFPNGQKNSEMVSDNYYEEELQYQDVINAKKNADLLAQKPAYLQFKDGIRINFPQEIIPDHNQINFVLFRTDDSNLDVKKSLPIDFHTHSILIPSKIIFPGSYTLKIKWEQNKKPYQIDYDVLWK